MSELNTAEGATQRVRVLPHCTISASPFAEPHYPDLLLTGVDRGMGGGREGMEGKSLGKTKSGDTHPTCGVKGPGPINMCTYWFTVWWSWLPPAVGYC